MTTTKRPDSKAPKSFEAISAGPEAWIRQFVKKFEMQALEASRKLPPNANASELQMATARALLATYIESGMEFELAIELLGQVAVERQSANVTWSNELNHRRFELIDKEIQGTLSQPEFIELAGLTKIMRDQIDTEANLPMTGARALHRKLLQLKSTGESA